VWAVPTVQEERAAWAPLGALSVQGPLAEPVLLPLEGVLGPLTRGLAPAVPAWRLLGEASVGRGLALGGTGSLAVGVPREGVAGAMGMAGNREERERERDMRRVQT